MISPFFFHPRFCSCRTPPCVSFFIFYPLSFSLPPSLSSLSSTYYSLLSLSLSHDHPKIHPHHHHQYHQHHHHHPRAKFVSLPLSPLIISSLLLPRPRPRPRPPPLSNSGCRGEEKNVEVMMGANTAYTCSLWIIYCV